MVMGTEQQADIFVANLIKDLSDLIQSCSKSDEPVYKNCTPIKQKRVSNNASHIPYNPSSSKFLRNKRKSGTPRKQAKRRLDSEYESLNESHLQFDNKQTKPLINCPNEDELDPILNIVEIQRKKRRSSALKISDIPTDVMQLIVQSGIDDKLENIAMKEKLTETHVKNIIKEVITDESVLSMLKQGLYGLDIGDPNLTSVFEPKLTRARKRELFEKQLKVEEADSFGKDRSSHSRAIPSLSPSSLHYSVLPEMQSMATTEFPDEEDDEEYQPEWDESIVSDEESIMSSLGSPANFTIQSERSRSSSVSSENFTKENGTPSSRLNWVVPSDKKHPQKCLNYSMEETSLICNRTRSKYPMTDTPLEHLEMAFKPPDITADMYETEIDDEDWKKFLLDYVQPQDVTKSCEDDDQVDPEYNLLADADEETPSLDELKEELRGDRAVRISKREVCELMTEFLDSMASEEEDEGDEDECDISTIPCEKTTDSTLLLTESSANDTKISKIDQSLQEPEQELSMQSSCSIHGTDLSSRPIAVEISPCKFSREQMKTLECQVTQHVQLLVQSILMSCYEEKFANFEAGWKNMLNDIFVAGKENPMKRSLLHTFNLEAALNTIHHYDSKRDEYLMQKAKKCDKKMENCGIRQYDRIYQPRFPAIIKKMFLMSAAMSYVELLPKGVFNLCDISRRRGFLLSEYYLLASTFSDVVSDVKVFSSESRKGNSKYFDSELSNICQRVANLSCVCTSGSVLITHLRRLFKENLMKGLHEENPLIQFTKSGKVAFPMVLVGDRVTKDQGLLALKDYDPKILPPHFQKIVESFQAPKKNSVLRSVATSDTSKVIVMQDKFETKIIIANKTSNKLNKKRKDECNTDAN